MRTHQLEEKFGFVRLQSDLGVQRPRRLLIGIVLGAQNRRGGELLDELFSRCQ